MFDDRSKDPLFVKWSKDIKIRDEFRCRICNRINVYLESHHLNSWATYPDQRYSLENGVCLCQRCHQLFHATFQKAGCTAYQFRQFQQIINIFKSIIRKNIDEKPDQK